MPQASRLRERGKYPDYRSGQHRTKYVIYKELLLDGVHSVKTSACERARTEAHTISCMRNARQSIKDLGYSHKRSMAVKVERMRSARGRERQRRHGDLDDLVRRQVVDAVRWHQVRRVGRPAQDLQEHRDRGRRVGDVVRVEELCRRVLDR